MEKEDNEKWAKSLIGMGELEARAHCFYNHFNPKTSKRDGVTLSLPEDKSNTNDSIYLEVVGGRVVSAEISEKTKH